VSSGFTRTTTLIRLDGKGVDGLGEDVTYDTEDHDLFQRECKDLPLAGRYTLASFSELLDGIELFPQEPGMEAARFYRRWAFESAALDLALGQVGVSLARALGRETRPLRFVVSKRLAPPARIDPIDRLIELYPGVRFKLDPTSDWTDALMDDLAARDVVDVVDLKGAYKGTVVDQPADADLYRRVVEHFPKAWIEDPDLTDRTRPLLEPHADRITWDAPIHSVADIENAPFPLRMVNIKPSRFGRLRDLFRAYDFCHDRGIGMYGGGQFELAAGRGQIQYLASLFHPETSNDVAPGGYNEETPGPGLPTSPLSPAPSATGFRWGS
ncbi:MAG: hypothetical protein R3344_16040, partial [Acidobacteriota bacterium]|nr:hypothetical protein [Acidobacteriota bacterium]